MTFISGIGDAGNISVKQIKTVHLFKRISSAYREFELVDREAVCQIIVKLKRDIWREMNGFDLILALQSRAEIVGIFGFDGLVIERDAEGVPALGCALGAMCELIAFAQ